jgi:hypothetical protein
MDLIILATRNAKGTNTNTNNFKCYVNGGVHLSQIQLWCRKAITLARRQFPLHYIKYNINHTGTWSREYCRDLSVWSSVWVSCTVRFILWPPDTNSSNVDHQYRAVVAQSVYRLGYGLDDRSSIPGKGNDGIFFLFVTRVQTSSGAHPASYPTDTMSSFLGGSSARE